MFPHNHIWSKFRNFMLADPLHDKLQDVVWSNSYVLARAIQEHSLHQGVQLDELRDMLQSLGFNTASNYSDSVLQHQTIIEQLTIIRTIMDVWTRMTLVDVAHKIDAGFQLMDKNEQAVLGTVLDAEIRLSDSVASLRTALVPPSSTVLSLPLYSNGPTAQPWRESMVNQVREEGTPAFIKILEMPAQSLQDIVFDLDELSVNDIMLFRVEMKIWRPCTDKNCLAEPCPNPRVSWVQSELYKVQMQTPTSKSRMQIIVNDQPIGPTKLFTITPLQGPWDIRLTMAQIGGTNAAVRWFTTVPQSVHC